MSAYKLCALELPEDTVPREEEANAARIADDSKVNALYRTINKIPHGNEFRNKLLNLACWLDPCEREWVEGISEFHETLASSSHLFDQSIRIGAAVTEMVRWREDQYFIVSIDRPEWRFEPENLDDVSLVDLIAEVNHTFKFIGISSSHGILLAFMHGHFDPIIRRFVLSIFGIADGPMAESIGSLRGLPGFKPSLETGDRISIQSLPEYSRPLSTLVQTDWPVKASFLNNNSNIQTIEFQGIIGDPYQAPSLLWRDRWKLENATLMIGLHVDGERLTRFPH